METTPCPRCGKPCPVGRHNSAHCTACFTSFRADAPTACLTAVERASAETFGRRIVPSRAEQRERALTAWQRRLIAEQVRSNAPAFRARSGDTGKVHGPTADPRGVDCGCGWGMLCDTATSGALCDCLPFSARMTARILAQNPGA